MKYIKWAEPYTRPTGQVLREEIASIIEDVRTNGDKAVLSYCEKLDQSTQEGLRVERSKIERAYTLTPATLLEDIKFCARNVEEFAKRQMETFHDMPETEIAPGVFIGTRIIPMDSCACYVPGGTYPLFSSALMLAIPARIAGVKRICACSPVVMGTDAVHPHTLAAMDIAGVTEIYAVGGAQAIAAFSYGTESIRPVDLIVGTGSQFVIEAKRQCFGQVGVDYLAGPSDMLVIADETADPNLIAADLVAQSEHSPMAKGVLIATSEELCQQVIREIDRVLQVLPTAELARAAWQNYGQVILVDSIEEAVDLANERAPECLELQIQDPETYISRFRNYGGMFIGNLAGVSIADYASGINHNLPTVHGARYNSGTYVGTFLKVAPYQRLLPEGVRGIATVAIHMASAEGLFGHANSARLRLKKARS